MSNTFASRGWASAGRTLPFSGMSLPVLLSAISGFAADLPVREVVLYKNGVAYFERSGDIKAGETARLEFKTSEMNDVLKSLTVSDGAGGKVSAVRYDSSEPLDRRLAEFPVRFSPGQPLSAFLDQMRGALVTLKYGNETVHGTIASARAVAGDRDRPEREQLTMVLDSGGLRAFDLGTVTSIHFDDAAIDRQLRAYLGVVNQARSADRRNVYIDSTAATGRKIAASYMTPSPVWKSSYRLIFGAAGEPVLEGWAIVDNTTPDDWDAIRLALVSGRPVSFISKLYEPVYRQRPFAELAEDRPLGPVVYDAALTESRAAVAGRAGPAPIARAQRTQPEALADEKQAFKAMSSADVNTTTREAGELFEYRFSTPITIKRGQSAMLPFMQDKVNARKLLIYSDQSMQNPMNAAEITNSTGKTLDGGPITVYDGGAYGGEALVETLKTGDKRLISYAVDVGTRVTTNIGSERDSVREIHYSRGILTAKSATEEIRTYTIRNAGAKAKTLIIEHPLRQGFKLIGTQKPVETTAKAYRFEVKLAPSAAETFPVKEEFVYDNTIEVRSLAPEQVLVYLQNKNLPEAARQALQNIAGQKRALAAVDSEIARLQAEATEIGADQTRLRQNIDSLNRVSGQEQQVRQYSQQLAGTETRMAAVRAQLDDQRRKKQTLEAALNATIESTVF